MNRMIGARGGTRTPTVSHEILSLARLPVPPLSLLKLSAFSEDHAKRGEGTHGVFGLRRLFYLPIRGIGCQRQSPLLKAECPGFLPASEGVGYGVGMGLKKLYLDIYEQFIRTRETHKGFHFQEETLKSVAPPRVTFTDRVKWWTLDRPNRLKKIERERDRQQQEILALKKKA